MLWLAPEPLQAQDRLQIVPTLSLIQEYETNPLAVEGGRNKIDDFVTRVSPSLSLIQRGTTGNARLTFGSRARFHQELSDLDTIDPYARFKVTQDLTRRLQLLSDGAYTVTNATDPVDAASFTIENGRPDVERWNAAAGFRYALTQLSNLRLSYRFSATEYEPTDESGGLNRDFDGGTLSLVHGLGVTPRDRLTTSVTWAQTRFVEMDPRVGIPGRERLDNDQLSVTLGWSHQLDQRTSFSVTGGVRNLKSEGSGFTNVILFLPGGGTTNLPQDDSNNLFTGGATLNRSFKRGRWGLSYNQSTRAASGRSSSVDQKTFRFDLTRRLSERATFKLNAGYTMQSSASENFGLVGAPGGFPGFCPPGSLPGFRMDPDGVNRGVCAVQVTGAIDEDVLSLSGRLDWRLTKRFTTFFGYGYLERNSSGISGKSYDTHRFRVGLRYTHDIDVP